MNMSALPTKPSLLDQILFKFGLIRLRALEKRAKEIIGPVDAGDPSEVGESASSVILDMEYPHSDSLDTRIAIRKVPAYLFQWKGDTPESIESLKQWNALSGVNHIEEHDGRVWVSSSHVDDVVLCEDDWIVFNRHGAILDICPPGEVKTDFMILPKLPPEMLQSNTNRIH